MSNVIEHNKNQEVAEIQYTSIYTVYGWLAIIFSIIPFFIGLSSENKAGLLIGTIMGLIGVLFILIGKKKG